MAASMTVNSNDAGLKYRLEFVERILLGTLKLKPHKIKSIAYEEGFPFPYNNFVYGVEISLEDPTEDLYVGQNRPGTQAIPAGTSSVVIRLSNFAWGYNHAVRVENEVAALSMARDALGAELQHLVPRVFAWSPATADQGWILQEYMPGQPLLEDFKVMKEQDQAKILGQMADVLGCFQAYEIPTSVQGYGGLRFGQAGEYLSAPLSLLDGGPFPTYEALVRKTIESKLHEAENDRYVQGWRDSDVRSRLEDFLARGLHRTMSASLDGLRKALVHGDLSTDNLLYDKETLRLTAVLDFDFAHVATIGDDFFRSLGHGIGRFPDTREDEEINQLHVAMLKGFPGLLPANNDKVNWIAARTWDDALRERNIARPSTIPDITTLADLFWLSSALLPFKLCNEVVVSNSTPEQLRRWKDIVTAQLQKFLSDYGF
ncbi:MAG: hypothetical protein M1820_005839 [Bogoriella megaspora]|nr:MAG: hypothetical protein M1820_005839 [Bogoriella megaspora]